MRHFRCDSVRRVDRPSFTPICSLAIKAAVGDVERFARPQKLVSYIGLNPSVRQSGPGPAYHGRITKQGRGMRAACWLRRLGQPRERLVPCGPFSFG